MLGLQVFGLTKITRFDIRCDNVCGDIDGAPAILAIFTVSEY